VEGEEICRTNVKLLPTPCTTTLLYYTTIQIT